MAVRISKKTAIFSVFGLFVIIAGGVGAVLIAQRLSTTEDVTPEEDEAAEFCYDGYECNCKDGYGVPSDGPENSCTCWCLTVPTNEVDCPDGQSYTQTCTLISGGGIVTDQSCETCVSDPDPNVGTCTWCTEGGVVTRGNCQCSDWNGDPSTCWSHSESGCWYMSETSQCICGGEPEDPDCNVTGSGGSTCTVEVTGCDNAVPLEVARCRESFDTLEEYNEATNFGTVCTYGCDSSTEWVTNGIHSFSVTPPDCGRWQLDVVYYGSSLCYGYGCEWDSAVCELEEEPCGNGVVEPSLGEECDPPGNTSQCPDDAVCASDCTCPEVTQTYLTVSGEVVCQDEGGERYPIEGANVQFYKGTPQLSEYLTTDSSGQFQSAANTTLKTQEPFSVSYTGLSDPTMLLPSGVAYSDMTGPVLENTAMCSDKCTTCTTDYSTCYGLTDGTNPGFRWVFSDCSLTQVNPNWEIEKVGIPVCIMEGTEDAYAEVSYTITVTNTSGGGTVEYVTDEFDESIADNWITSTVPTATSIEDGVITWTLSGTEGEFSEGESTTFQYVVEIPETLFGDELNNHSIARLSTGEDLHAYEDIFVTCGGAIPTVPLPGTGLFDNTVARLMLGVVLVGLGYGYYKFGLLESGVLLLDRVRGGVSDTFSREAQNTRWERKMVKRVDGKNKRKSTRRSKKK